MGAASSNTGGGNCLTQCWSAIDPPPQRIRIGETYKLTLQPDQKYFGQIEFGAAEAAMGEKAKAGSWSGDEKIIEVRVQVTSGELRRVYMARYGRFPTNKRRLWSRHDILLSEQAKNRIIAQQTGQRPDAPVTAAAGPVPPTRGGPLPPRPGTVRPGVRPTTGAVRPTAAKPQPLTVAGSAGAAGGASLANRDIDASGPLTSKYVLPRGGVAFVMSPVNTNFFAAGQKYTLAFQAAVDDDADVQLSCLVLPDTRSADEKMADATAPDEDEEKAEEHADKEKKKLSWAGEQDAKRKADAERAENDKKIAELRKAAADNRAKPDADVKGDVKGIANANANSNANANASLRPDANLNRATSTAGANVMTISHTAGDSDADDDDAKSPHRPLQPPAPLPNTVTAQPLQPPAPAQPLAPIVRAPSPKPLPPVNPAAPVPPTAPAPAPAPAPAQPSEADAKRQRDLAEAKRKAEAAAEMAAKAQAAQKAAADMLRDAQAKAAAAQANAAAALDAEKRKQELLRSSAEQKAADDKAKADVAAAAAAAAAAKPAPPVVAVAPATTPGTQPDADIEI